MPPSRKGDCGKPHAEAASGGAAGPGVARYGQPGSGGSAGAAPPGPGTGTGDRAQVQGTGTGTASPALMAVVGAAPLHPGQGQAQGKGTDTRHRYRAQAQPARLRWLCRGCSAPRIPETGTGNRARAQVQGTGTENRHKTGLSPQHRDGFASPGLLHYLTVSLCNLK